MNKNTYVSHDGVKLNLYASTIQNPKAVVYIAHGMAEHAGRYEHFAKLLNESGYDVYADDHRAHGESMIEGYRLGSCEGDVFADTVEDIQSITRYLKGKYSLPVFVIGHSYGSFLTQAFMECPNVADGYILIGSARMPKILTSSGRIVAVLTKLFKGEHAPAKMLANINFGGYDKKFREGKNAWLSVDMHNRDAYNQDPMCGQVMSAGFYESFFRGISTLYLKKNLANVSKHKPILILSGTMDAVGGFKKYVASLYDTYVSIGANVSLKLVEGARHEVLNETDTLKQEANESILNFLSMCLGSDDED